MKRSTIRAEDLRAVFAVPPLASDGRSTSVGTRPAFRFTRAVCYQGFVDEALPDELKDANPLNIRRMIDAKITKSPVSDKL